jgi:hypothetical protein
MLSARHLPVRPVVMYVSGGGTLAELKGLSDIAGILAFIPFSLEADKVSSLAVPDFFSGKRFCLARSLSAIRAN